jgi:carbonic anhydrase
VEKIFDQGFGDLFVIRAAGAVPGVDQLGSLEYAVAHLGVPVILVLAHTKCGAVTAAVSGAHEPGALGELLAKLDPVAKIAAKLEESGRLNAAIELSASMFREQISLSSPVIAQAVKDGHLKVISGVYDIDTGEVKLDE